eukprot:COSAG01_NODE_1662_length_9555_cov_32.392718_12_plen_105_part_00
MIPMGTRLHRYELDVLCAEVRSDALPLLAAFDIPDYIVRAPIGVGEPDLRLYLQGVGFATGRGDRGTGGSSGADPLAAAAAAAAGGVVPPIVVEDAVAAMGGGD